jgi:L-rhamnose-H+ transport protein
VATSLPIGISLTLVAGLMSGNCMLPMKFSRSWRWENTWLVFSVVSLIILPWALALGLGDHPFEAYNALSLTEIAVPFLFGVGWGIAQVLFGISVQRLGLGLAYAIIVGLGALLGTLVPLFVQHRAQVGGRELFEILLGVAVMIIGIGLSTWGGQIRELIERDKHGDAHGDAQPKHANAYFAAVMLAILCGVMAPMLNFSFAFGQDIARQAVRLGNTELHAAYAVWPIGLTGGFLPNIAYSLYLLRRNRSWPLFKGASTNTTDMLLPVLMGVLWMGAFALYGMSATYLGSLGTSIGWGLFQIFMIMTAMLSGVLTGEWRSASRASRLLLVSGFACLTCATALLAMGNH